MRVLLLLSLFWRVSGDIHVNASIAEERRIAALENMVASLSHQLMAQQLAAEERIRSEGNSGVKQLRHNRDGTKSYYGETHTGSSINAIHDHSNYDRTCGMGEVQAVLNGVEFRTRHNDYKLGMPDPMSKTYNKMVDIPFPPVPPSVLSRHNVSEQVIELREYFRAFQQQDTHIRDWVPYFKPVLCYMEAGWTTNTKTLDEPFKSDRHFIDAASWMELQEKIRYTAYTGGKIQSENHSNLPTTIINVTKDGIPVFAQWNYRIACHPIKRYLGLKHLRLVDDVGVRMAQRLNITQLGSSRAARFSVSPIENPSFKATDGYGNFKDTSFRYGLLDQLMSEIPGKDNYQAFIEDNAFGLDHYDIRHKNNTKLNAGYYHRWFKVAKNGGMGITVRHRGFSDQNLFTAHTTQTNIAEMSVQDCNYDSRLLKSVCQTYRKRVTYAIPLEIIWLTPLSSWNPYNLEMNGQDPHKIVMQGGRNGGLTADKAYNGTSLSNYYLTPVEFFQGGEVGRDPADTAKDIVGVLDKHGEVKHVVPSGIRIFTPHIPGVGKFRLRYPIVPIHAEGNSMYKEVEALKALMMEFDQYSYILTHKPVLPDQNGHVPMITLRVPYTSKTPPGGHYHDVYISAEDKHALMASENNTLHVVTSEQKGHRHELLISYDHRHYNYKITTCDHKPHCSDDHQSYLYELPY
ncbi:hypothetical protein ACJMK2_029216 [Sinanodonta woodiana]|uniref:Uncharacterized protein n=1 Tax=Sinanodonta woodiana TaxID=1069815 RepID=A0ABD3X9I6_SINWO